MARREREFHGPAIAAVKTTTKRGLCGATTKRGVTCPAPGSMPDARCPQHSTSVSEAQKTAWRKRGHKSLMQSREPVRFLAADLSSETSARALVEETINFARAGKIATSTANAVAKLVAVGLRASELKLAAQVAAMEKSMKEQGVGRRRPR